MNIAVDPEHRRAGVAKALLDAVMDKAGHDANYTLEVRVSNAGAIALYERYGFRGVGTRPRYYADNGEDAIIMWRAVGTPWEAVSAGRAVILAIETSCDDTCAALITAEGEIRANVISSQGVHDRFGGVVPEIASRHHLTLLPAVIDEALRDGRRDARRCRAWSPRPAVPGLVAALLVGFCAAKSIAAARELPFAPVDHLHGHLAASFLKPAEFEPPFLALIASGGHTLLADVRDHGPELQRARPDARRCRRRGVRQGRAAARARLSGRCGARAPCRRGRPGGLRLPRRAQRMPGLDFSFAGLKTALLYASGTSVSRRPSGVRADLAASYQRAIVEALLIRVRRALKQTGCHAACRSAAESLPTGRCGTRSAGWVSSSTSRARALHRQRRDDRERRALLAGAAVPGLPGA